MKKYLPGIVFSTALLVVWLFQPSAVSVGYSTGGDVWKYFAYMFFHAGFLHWLCNGYALVLLLGNRSSDLLPLGILVYAISVVAAFIVPADIPTVGASSMVFAICGTYLSHGFGSRKNMLIMTLSLTVGFFMPGVSGWIHAVSFILGVMAARLWFLLRRIYGDYRATA